MIITRTPLRVSFFGGGTDYPEWYLKEGGAVLSTTIDKYIYLTIRIYSPIFSITHRIVWAHIEAVSTISEILHPAIREGLKYLGFDDSVGLEIHYQGDLPARTGMGSSSAFSVGLIKALKSLKGEMISKRDLARAAIHLEHDILKENVGAQDQIATAFGGLNTIQFLTNGEFIVEPLTISNARLEEFQSNLMLFCTGSSRLASEIAADIVTDMDKKSETLNTMRSYVDQAVDILSSNRSLDEFGKLMNENWKLKCNLSSMISNQNIEGIYQEAIDQGALGGKLLGAGGSGFLLFYAPQEKQAAVAKALARYLYVPFQFEREGCTLIYYDAKNTEYFEKHKKGSA